MNKETEAFLIEQTNILMQMADNLADDYPHKHALCSFAENLAELGHRIREHIRGIRCAENDLD